MKYKIVTIVYRLESSQSSCTRKKQNRESSGPFELVSDMRGFIDFMVEVTGIEPVSVDATNKTTTSVVSIKSSPMTYVETHGQWLAISESFAIDP